MPAGARIPARFERDQLAGFIAVALDLIDTMDGDPDFENATDLEDDHALSRRARGYDKGPGCEVSDTGEDDDIETGIEDDPRGFDPETDFGAEELGEREDCAPGECSDPIARLGQRERIRQTRCDKIVFRNSWHGYGGGQEAEYRLREQGPSDPVKPVDSLAL